MHVRGIIHFFLAATVAVFWACSNSNEPEDTDRPDIPDIVEPDTTKTDTSKTDTSKADTSKTDSVPELRPDFIQNEEEYTGFYKEDGYAAFQKMAYTAKTEMGTSYLVKFVITGFDTDSPEVHFMNTQRYPIHYDFAQIVLGDTRSVFEFERETYFTTEKNTVAGTLAYYASLDSTIALTFFPTDYITPEQVIAVHKLIEGRMLFLTPGASKNKLIYMPAGTNAERAAAEIAQDFKDAHIDIYTHAQLFGDVALQIMNTGTAYGTLRKLTAAELDTAIVSSHDILIL